MKSLGKSCAFELFSSLALLRKLLSEEEMDIYTHGMLI